jgi:predicted DNA-binding protein
MTTIRVSPSLDRLINDALKRLPVSQTRDQFVQDAVNRYIEELRDKRFWVT